MNGLRRSRWFFSTLVCFLASFELSLPNQTSNPTNGSIKRVSNFKGLSKKKVFEKYTSDNLCCS